MAWLVSAAALLMMCTAGAQNTAAVHKAETSSGEMASLMSAGEAVYKTQCAACHQATGQGLAGAFPPLAQSDYLLASRERVLETILLGLAGEITVNGVKYNAVMPAMGHISDSDIAAVATYVSNAWAIHRPHSTSPKWRRFAKVPVKLIVPKGSATRVPLKARCAIRVHHPELMPVLQQPSSAKRALCSARPNLQRQLSSISSGVRDATAC